jgi:hypothetical protein
MAAIAFVGNDMWDSLDRFGKAKARTRARQALIVAAPSPSPAQGAVANGKNRAQGMVRSMDQWRNMVPLAVMSGSMAQIEYALVDAKHDIEMLWCALASLSQPAKTMEPLGAEFEKVWDDNVSTLYEDDSSPAAPSPPGWPDPLESPQAEAIRNGKIDHAEILSLFDRMQREIDFHRSSPAEARAARLEALLRKIRWYVEAYDTREHNRDQDKDLTEIDAALDVKEAG